MNPKLLRIMVFTLLVGFCPVPVSDFLIGFGFAPVSFVAFWIALELVSFASLLHLIYLVEAVIYMALFWFLAGRMALMAPRWRGLTATALLAGSVLLWLAPIHIRIEQGVGEEKQLATLFGDEYHRFQDLRAPHRPEDAMIYQPPPGTVHTRTIAPQTDSRPTNRPGVVQRPAAEAAVPRADE